MIVCLCFNRTEANVVLNDVVLAYNKVEKWAKPENATFKLDTAPMRPKIRHEPKGVVLIIG